jgi:hypothetical protein
MLSAYDRDDGKRLITATVTEPISLQDLIDAVERQAAEDTWSYALLYDLRGAAMPLSDDMKLQQLADRVQVLGAGRTRGPVAAAVPLRPDMVRSGLLTTQRTAGRLSFEVLLTSQQVKDWLARNTRSGESPRGL